MGREDVVALTLPLAFDDDGIRGVRDGPVNVEGSSRLDLQAYSGSATCRREARAGRFQGACVVSSRVACWDLQQSRSRPGVQVQKISFALDSTKALELTFSPDLSTSAKKHVRSLAAMVVVRALASAEGMRAAKRARRKVQRRRRRGEAALLGDVEGMVQSWGRGEA